MRGAPSLIVPAIVLLAVACGPAHGGTALEGDATQGRSLWVQSACAGCHGINGEGSAGGPALAYTPLTIREFSSIVRRGGPGMPKYPASQFSDQDLRNMYAWSLNPVPVAAGEPGQNPWAQSPCVGCHGVGALGGSGPALAGTSQALNAFRTVVRQGAEGMPAYSASQISDADVEQLYDWLQAKAEVPAAQDTPTAKEEPWVEAGCGGCHGAQAEGGLATALTGETYSYDEFQEVVREGEDGMPAYSASQISDTDLQRLYDWLRAQAEVPAAQEDPWVEAGCGGCHGAKAEGGAAPTLTDEEYTYGEFQRVVRGGEDGMPAYSASQISDSDLQRMYDWLRAQAEVPAVQEDPWAQAGCGGCHGAKAEGGAAPALTDEEYSYDEFQRVVRGGEDGMPAYSASQISDADLQRMYNWLSALP